MGPVEDFLESCIIFEYFWLYLHIIYLQSNVPVFSGTMVFPHPPPGDSWDWSHVTRWAGEQHQQGYRVLKQPRVMMFILFILFEGHQLHMWYSVGWHPTYGTTLPCGLVWGVGGGSSSSNNDSTGSRSRSSCGSTRRSRSSSTSTTSTT